MTTSNPQPQSENRLILSIGVGQTKLPEWSLPITAKDASDIAGLLDDPYSCNTSSLRLLSNEQANTSMVRDAFNWLKELGQEKHDVTVFIYFSGHGIRLPTKNGYSYFLILHDTQFPFDGDWERLNIHIKRNNTAPKRDIEALIATGIQSDDLSTLIKSINSSRLVTFLDCCHAQGMAQLKGLSKPTVVLAAAPSRVLLDISAISGRAIISSSTDNQSSWVLAGHMNSVFTEGLKRALNDPGLVKNGYIGVMTAFPYISSFVRQSVHRMQGTPQQPLFSAQNLTSDIPIVYRKTEMKNGIKDLSKNPSITHRARLFQIEQAEGLYKNIEMRLIALQRDLETRVTEVDKVPLTLQRQYLYDELRRLANELETLYGMTSI